MSRSKAQGTRFESYLIAHKLRTGNAWRLAEGGEHDAGDITWRLPSGDHVVIEAKRRENLPVHAALAKAKGKVAAADLPFIPLLTVVVWDRPALKAGNVRRSRVGEPVVIVGLDDFIKLVS